MSRLLTRVLLGLCAVAFAGCGSDAYRTAPVRGKVFCQGKPAAGGTITFLPVDDPGRTGRPAGHSGGGSSGTVGADGTFTLTGNDGKPGALVGLHRVLFQPPPTKRPRLSGDDRASMSPEEIKEAEEKIRQMPVYPPLPCGDQPTPGEVEVKPGDNEFEFTLRPK